SGSQAVGLAHGVSVRLLDVGEEPARHPEEPPARRLDGELTTRNFQRRGEGNAGGREADGILRPDFQRSVEVETHARRRHVQHLAGFFPPNLELVLFRLELSVRPLFDGARLTGRWIGPSLWHQSQGRIAYSHWCPVQAPAGHRYSEVAGLNRVRRQSITGGSS